MTSSQSVKIMSKKHAYASRALLSGGLFAVASCLAAGTAGAVAAGAATPSAAPPYSVSVQAEHTLTTIGTAALGANTPPWAASLLTPAVPGLVRSAGIREVVFNGGPMDDLYHWRTNSVDPLAANYGYQQLAPRYNFDQWASFARSQHETMLVHVNYGTGTPSEAAAWVRYANLDKHYGVRYWEVGEEEYGDGAVGFTFEPDGHPASQHSAEGYATNALAFIKAMKAADPGIQIGIPVLATDATSTRYYGWDTTVLKKLGPYIDFVDVHWYPMFTKGPDAAVLATPSEIAPNFAALQQLLTKDGDGRHISIQVGETNSEAQGYPQTSSLTNALYLAETVPALLANGAQTVDWWALQSGLQGNDSTGVGDLGLLSSGSQDCLPASNLCAPPVDTPYPDYYAMELVSSLAGPGARLVAVTSPVGTVNVHAAVRPDGRLAVLFANTDPAQPVSVLLSAPGYATGRPATRLFYGQGSSRVTDGHIMPGSQMTLPPYSLTEIVLDPPNTGTGA
jgi:alpha-L-arabinofuranosidase